MRRQPADTKFKANRSSHSIKMKKSEKSITTGQEPYSWKHMNSRTPRRSCRDMSRTWEVFVGHLLFCTGKKDPGLLRTPGPSFIYGTVLFQILFSRSLLMEPFFSQPLHTARMRRSLSETGNVPGRFFHCEMVDCECSGKNNQRERSG